MSRIELLQEYVDLNDLHDFSLLKLEKYHPEKKTILILDDATPITYLMLKLIKRTKLTDKYNVETGDGCDVALKVLKTLYTVPTFTVDYILTDITFSNNIVVNRHSYSYTGIDIAGLLYKENPALVYRFLTAHNVSKINTPTMFKSYAKYKDDNLLDYVELKNKKISDNIGLISKLVGTYD